MTIHQNQLEMRQGHWNGVPGVFVSGITWMLAALMAQLVSESVGVLILFLGGMAIYPLSTFVCHSMIGTNRPGKSNRLNRLGLESTAIIFLGLFLGYIGLHSSPGYFFTTMTMAVGVRYLTFQTIYGLKSYWVLGGVLAFTGIAIFQSANQWATLPALLTGLIELGMATLMALTIRDNPIAE